MKLNLKAIDYRQLALDHGEKAVLGLVGLFGLWAVLSSNWVPEKRAPEELKSVVNSSQTQLNNTTWPEEEQQKFTAAIDVRQEVQRMLQPVNIARFEYSEPSEMDWPLYRREDPIKEPQWIALRNLKSTPVRTIFAIEDARAKDSLLAGMPGAPGAVPAEAADPEADDELARRFGRKNGGRNGAAGPGIGPDAAGLVPGGGIARDAASPADPLLAAGPGYPGGPDGMGMGGGTGVTGEGRRFVAVRGVFPLGRQMRLIADALHTTTSRVEESVQFINFELQRKKAIAGDNPWAGDWEDVDIDAAMQLLKKVVDFDEDVVDISVTDPVFTMPLPARVIGEWMDEATHPELQNYMLTPEAREQQRALNQKLLELKQQMNEQGRSMPVQPKGFAVLQHDMGKIRRDMVNAPGFDDVAASVAREFQPGMESDRMADNLKQRITSAAGQLLLFRYFDFEVTPGNAYIYRVRFEVTNPNYQRPPASLENPESAIGETRWTPWSDPSDPSTIEEDVHYFVADASPARGRNLPSVVMDMFQWFPDAGTITREKVKVEPGQIIGGVKETLVLRPAEETFEEESRHFQSEDVLLDVHTGPRFTSADDALHADLKLTSELRATRLGIVDQAIVADAAGEIRVVDSSSGVRQQKRLETLLGYQNGPWEDLKNKGDEEGMPNDLVDFAGPGAAGPMAEENGRRKRRGRRNSIRKDPGMMLMP